MATLECLNLGVCWRLHVASFFWSPNLSFLWSTRVWFVRAAFWCVWPRDGKYSKHPETDSNLANNLVQFCPGAFLRLQPLWSCRQFLNSLTLAWTLGNAVERAVQESWCWFAWGVHKTDQLSAANPEFSSKSVFFHQNRKLKKLIEGFRATWKLIYSGVTRTDCQIAAAELSSQMVMEKAPKAAPTKQPFWQVWDLNSTKSDAKIPNNSHQHTIKPVVPVKITQITGWGGYVTGL